jgi:hypothetical protein
VKVSEIGSWGQKVTSPPRDSNPEDRPSSGRSYPCEWTIKRRRLRVCM